MSDSTTTQITEGDRRAKRPVVILAGACSYTGFLSSVDTAADIMVLERRKGRGTVALRLSTVRAVTPIPEENLR